MNYTPKLIFEESKSLSQISQMLTTPHVDTWGQWLLFTKILHYYYYKNKKITIIKSSINNNNHSPVDSSQWVIVATQGACCIRHVP